MSHRVWKHLPKRLPWSSCYAYHGWETVTPAVVSLLMIIYWLRCIGIWRKHDKMLLSIWEVHIIPFVLHQSISRIQTWPLPPDTVTINTLRPPFSRRQFQMHFLNENVWISIKISLTFVPKSPFNNIPALVQIMACQATRHCLNQLWLAYWRMYVSLGLSELSIRRIICTVIMKTHLGNIGMHNFSWKAHSALINYWWNYLTTEKILFSDNGNIVVTGGTGCCHDEDLRCHIWR